MRKVLLIICILTSLMAIQKSQKSINGLKKACKQGDMRVCNYLGVLYADGLGIKQNYFRAREFFLKACNGRHAKACYNIGVSYAQGKGVREDMQKAKEFFGKACDLEHQGGCDNYAKIHQDSKSFLDILLEK